MLMSKLEEDVEEGTLAGACLDALLALLANSPQNQQTFLKQEGLVREGVALLYLCHPLSENLHVLLWSNRAYCYSWGCRPLILLRQNIGPANMQGSRSQHVGRPAMRGALL